MHQKKILVISDLDGTLTTEQSSWQYILERLNLWIPEGKKNLEKFLNKEINYDEFIQLDVSLLKGVPVHKYLDVINSIKFNQGAFELFDYFKATSSKNIIVSSGLMDLAIKLNNFFPLSQIFANVIHNDGEVLTGSYVKNVGWNDKKGIMKNIKSAHPNYYIIAFGDTSADLPLIQMSDLSFSCFSHSDELIAAADYNITNLLDAIEIISNELRE